MGSVTIQLKKNDCVPIIDNFSVGQKIKMAQYPSKRIRSEVQAVNGNVSEFTLTLKLFYFAAPRSILRKGKSCFSKVKYSIK